MYLSPQLSYLFAYLFKTINLSVGPCSVSTYSLSPNDL